jgi:hypothetical protein
MNRNIGKFLIAIILLGIVLASVIAIPLFSHVLFPLDNDQMARQRLTPAIEFVEQFLAEHKRIPTEAEFYAWNKDVLKNKWKRHHHYAFRDRSHPYAVSKGAKGPNDYMVGYWRSEWHLYYRSWDKTYFDAHDESDWFAECERKLREDFGAASDETVQEK